MRQENINVIPTRTAATVTTAAIPATQLFSCSAQVSTTGAGAAGVLKIQASLDVTGTPSVAPSNWSDIPSATVTVSGAGAFLIPKTDICYQWLRIVYTNTGTGTFGVNFKALGD